MISRSGISKEIGGIEFRTVPKLVKIAMELVGSRFGDVVDL